MLITWLCSLPRGVATHVLHLGYLEFDGLIAKGGDSTTKRRALAQTCELVFTYSEEHPHGAVVGDAHDRSARTDEFASVGIDLCDQSINRSGERSLLEVSAHFGDRTRSTVYEGLGCPLIFPLSTIHSHVILATCGTLGGTHGIELCRSFVELLRREDALLIECLGTGKSLLGDF